MELNNIIIITLNITKGICVNRYYNKFIYKSKIVYNNKSIAVYFR